MSISESMAQTAAEEAAERKAWGFEHYIALPCPNCSRQRLHACPNGKTRCEACNWVVEDRGYCPLKLTG